MSKANGYLPKARKDQLFVKELSNETLVYDETNHKAHCLNETAAFVWRNCDGRTSVTKLAARLGRELNGDVSEEVIWLAMDQLSKSHLLEHPLPIMGRTTHISRREATRALGLGTIVAVPLITSIVAPRAVAAATGPACRTLGQSCSGPLGAQSNCCAGLQCCNSAPLGQPILLQCQANGNC